MCADMWTSAQERAKLRASAKRLLMVDTPNVRDMLNIILNNNYESINDNSAVV